MNRGECITRLFDAYNKKASTGLLYYYEEWAKGLSIEMVSSIIDAVVKENAYLPTVNKLYELSKERLGHRVDSEPEEECFFCDGIGLIPGIYQDNQQEWQQGIISTCKCSKGKRMASDAIPQRNFELDYRYLDLMKFGKHKKESAWGSVVYFNSRLVSKRRELTKAE